MNDQKKEIESSPAAGTTPVQSCCRLRLPGLFAGLVAGFLLCGLAVVLAMPRMMLVVHESRYATVDETAAKLKEAIESNGWNCPMVRNLNASVAKEGGNLSRQVRIVELCKAAYAEEVLASRPDVSTLMPCAFGVYEGEQGKIFISGMNTGLMGKMFGGVVAKVMGGAVAADEQRILAAVVK